MKKKIQRLMLLSAAILIALVPSRSEASEAYKTYAISVDGEPIETQTAYEAVEGLSNDRIEKPEDLFIDEQDRVYIADSAVKRIVVLGADGAFERAIGEGKLQQPTGVTVDQKGRIYVADSGRILVFSPEGQWMKTFERPDSPLFGRNQIFQPSKLAVDVRGNLYVIGEGAANGVIQLNDEGEFSGYFGANTAPVSFLQSLRGAAEKAGGRSGFINVPIAPSNIALDERGTVYTVTRGLKSQAVKKLNVAGKNILSGGMYEPEQAIDIHAGKQGNFYVLGAQGKIYEYDSTGNLLFMFGSSASDSQRLGILKEPSAIAVDSKGRIYAADRAQGIIHVFEATGFAELVHRGLRAYEEGLYVESEPYWRDVLQLNSSFALAHTAMGEAYFKQLAYEDSLRSFELAQDKKGYSEAFWEIRYDWIQRHAALLMMSVLLLFALWKIAKWLDRRYDLFAGIRQASERMRQIRFVEEWLLAFKMLRHPLDVLYDIKMGKKGSVLVASVLYGLTFLGFLLWAGASGFLFSPGLLERFSFFLIVTLFLSVCALFVGLNYLVSTITDGEGRFAQVYMVTAYALTPYVLLIVPITLLSQVLTLNESFVYELALQIVAVWCLINLFVSIKEIHDFTIRETVKNLLLTFFSSVVTVTLLIISYILLNQIYEFAYSLIREVTIRA